MSGSSPSFSADDADPAREQLFRTWLGDCAGFRVDSPSGRVGIIGDLRRDPSGTPVELVVLTGLLGRRRTIGVELVAQIVPRESRLVLRPQVEAG